MTNKIYKLCCIMVILLITCNIPLSVLATSSTLNSEKEQVDEQIQQKKEEKEAIQNEKSDVLSEVESLIYQISDYESQVEQLTSEISSLEAEIVDAQEELAVEEENYKKQDEAMKERLIVIYEAGETTFLDILLGSDGLVDFISNYYLASEIAKADADMLEQIENKKNEIEAKKNGLEENKEKLEQTKKNKEETSRALYDAKRVKDQMVSELSAEEQALQVEIEKFEAEKQAIEAELRRIAEEEARQNGGYTNVKPSECGYISPIPGTSKNNITCGFYGYSGHGGVDFGGHYGKPVVAVKSGTVVTSKTTYGSIPNYDANGNYIGSYSSYGEYIIINHHDGTMTLYAHGKPGSRLVKSGDTVVQGQQIMTVGNTGNVFPRPSSNYPRNGAHLHFEVRVNGARVNPTQYLP